MSIFINTFYPNSCQVFRIYSYKWDLVRLFLKRLCPFIISGIYEVACFVIPEQINLGNLIGENVTNFNFLKYILFLSTKLNITCLFATDVYFLFPFFEVLQL